MTTKSTLVLFTAALTVLGIGATAAALEKKSVEKNNNRKTIQLGFITHLDAGLAEQDVFIEHQSGTGGVYRPTTGDHNMAARLYTSETEIPHDPFNKEATGPYKAGKQLDLTLGQWLKHRGAGVYHYANGKGTLELTFEGLVPGGTYTIWHAFVPVVPPVPFTGALELPLGAPDGSESHFVADAQGKAAFTHTVKPGLEFSDVWTNAMLALSYHSDGKIHGGHPGQFGENSHVALFVKLPRREGIE